MLIFMQSHDISEELWKSVNLPKLILNFQTDHRERAKFKCERSDMDSSYNPVSLSSINSAEQYSTGAQCIPSAVTVIAPAHHPENTTESWSNYYGNHSAPNSFGRNVPPKRRCRDYDGN